MEGEEFTLKLIFLTRTNTHHDWNFVEEEIN